MKQTQLARAVLFASASVLFASAVLVVSGSGRGFGQSVPARPDGEEGVRVFRSANCVGCHKWSGIGGGGYGGAAANLRHTELTHDQVVETIRCGRPGTGMPYFVRDGYSGGGCYGLTKADLPDGQMPPEPDHYLRPKEIEAVADYVLGHFKGKGEPNFAECQAFFGTQTRVCDSYAKDRDNGVASAPSPGPSGKPGPSRMKVESAKDVNGTDGR